MKAISKLRRGIAILLSVSMLLETPFFSNIALAQEQTATENNVVEREVSHETNDEGDILSEEEIEDVENAIQDDIIEENISDPNMNDSTTDNSVAEEEKAVEEEDFSAGEEVIEEEDFPAAEEVIEEETLPAGDNPIEEETQITDENDDHVIVLQTSLLSGEPDYLTLEQANLTPTGNVIKITKVDDLILLSNCNPAEYKGYNLEFGVSGEINTINATAVLGDQVYLFRGLGSAENPYSGTWTGASVPITIGRSLFNGLSSSATLFDNNTQIINWKGTDSVPMLAGTYIFDETDEIIDNNFPVKIIVDATQESEVYKYSSSQLIGTINGANETLIIGKDKVAYNGNVVIQGNENAGLICDTLESGKVQLDNISYPLSYTITAVNGSAGGLIGRMESGTELEVICQDLAETSTTITGTQNAGGIVGESSNAEIKLNNFGITSNISATVSSAGGIIGSATNTKISSSSVSINSLNVTGVNAGGLFGSYMQSSVNDDSKPFTPAAGIVIPNQISVNGSYIAGGMFGYVELSGDACVSVESNDIININSELQGSILGGIAGQVVGAGTTNSLTVKNYSVSYSKKGDPTYLGGVVGLLGEDENSTKAAALVFDHVTTSTSTPSASNAKDRNFGGAVGRLAEGSVLDAKNLTVTTTEKITGGGAVVGNARPGSAVRLSGTTDLSGVQYTESAYEGQIIGYQDSALIYALGNGSDYVPDTDLGWTLKRPNNEYMLDDIGGYGEVIRLKKEEGAASGLSSTLIAMNANHQVTLSGSINYSQIATVDDFARLAITWQTKGYFSGDTSIKTGTWEELNSKDITITGNIDLSGTGITGFTRDIDMDSAYDGTMNGNDYTITLAIGEAYGIRNGVPVTNDTEGSGKTYRHGRLGLFAAANGNVSHLKIAGNIYAYAKSEMAIGGYSACITGTSATESTVSDVNISPTMNIKADDKIAVYVGGMYGILASEGLFNQLVFESSNQVAANITLSSTPNSFTHIGGVIGAISATSIADITVKDLTIGGRIESNLQSEYCYAGGFIATIWPSSVVNGNRNTIEFKGLKFNGFSLNEKATTSVGGLLGYCWADTDVTFIGTAMSNYGLSITDSSVNAENCQNLGGLVYRAGGSMWKIDDYGIDMSGATINGGTNSLGLLVNYGFTSNVTMNNQSKSVASLYLNNTVYWGSAYKVDGCTIQSTPDIFDEWVAYSAESASTICDNGKGIISLRTQDDTVTMDGKNINTYENRTDYGKSHQTNYTSRYYYNLNFIRNQLSEGNQYIDTPGELLLWSVYHYADSKLRSYITFDDAPYGSSLTNRPIGSSDSNLAILDMKGFSYYPINLTDTNLTVKNASIKFYAKEIAEGEQSNKTNIGTENKHTQHYIMHCGLLRNYYGSTRSASSTSCTLNVKNIVMGGTVGVVNQAWSGALIMGSMKGISGRTSVVSIDGLTMDNLSVYNPETINVYPLLINCAYSYVTLNLTNVQGMSLPDSAASSLIGSVGIPTSDQNGTGLYKDATQLAMTFSKIKLPDTVGKFTRATLLESFRYNEGMIGSASYNFYKAEDQEHALVTYGKEITETVEYTGKQLWYYDAGTYNQDTGLVFGKDGSASAYLPYVHSKYTSDGIDHEIKVNQRSIDIVAGCGSYGDPYVITDAATLEAIAAYMVNSAVMPDHITLVDMQEGTTENNGGFELCTASTVHHRTYERDGSSWVEVTKNENDDWVEKAGGKTLQNTTVHDYVLNAYYQINGTILLENFVGLGNKDNVFRGVLVGKDGNATIKITGNSECLIPYSYGSVVKNLNIEYNVTKTLTYTAPVSIAQNGVNINIYSTAFFGGVFGCVLGGDNIIDSVEVNVSGVSVSGEQSHLIPTGNYVGLISGGGVVFRNNDNKSNMANVKNTIGDGFYHNPYVGRVLNGFAFSEGVVLNNKDQNYKINKLEDQKCLDVDDGATTITVDNAQGLLVLSALVNSGAVTAKNGSSSSLAYAYSLKEPQDGYRFGSVAGKKRHADYDKVGAVDASIDNDYIEWNKSNWDDFYACRETSPSYLVYKYVRGTSTDATYSASKSTVKDSDSKINKNASYICRDANHWTIVLVDNSVENTYDMSGFGSGYRGIGGRYTCNAMNIGTMLQYSRCNPELNILKGNNATITLNTVVKEYADDDFHAASVGGLFNVLRTQKTGTESTIAKNLTLTGTVSLQYYDKDKHEVPEITNGRSDYYDGKYCVSVGGFAGNTVAYYIYKNYIFDNIKIQDASFAGPNSVGSIMGSTGLSNADSKKGFGIVLGNDSGCIWGIKLQNCSYKSISVTAGYAAGGFVGYIAGKDNYLISAGGNESPTDEQKRTSGVQITNTFEDYLLAEDSKIMVSGTTSKKNSFAGGIFGFCGTNLEFNVAGNESANMLMKDVSVGGGNYTGGVIGCEKGVDNVSVKYLSLQSTSPKTKITSGPGGSSYVGGAFGEISVKDPSGIEIQNIQLSGTLLESKESDTDKKGYIGGVIGYLSKTGYADIEGVQLTNVSVKFGESVGGVVGYLSNSKCVNIEGVQLTNISVNVGNSAGGVVGYVSSGNKELNIINTSVNAGGDNAVRIGYYKDNSKSAQAGGIIGHFDSVGKVKLDGCVLQNIEIPYGAYNGGFIGNVNMKTEKVSVCNSVLKDSVIRGSVVGGVVGAFHGKFYGSNILVSNTLITKETTANKKSTGVNIGILLGVYGSGGTGKGVYVAGLSIQPGVNYGKALLPDAIVGTKHNSANTADTYNGYIAFADYTGACLNNNGSETVLGATQKSPYAVTSPISGIKVKESSDSAKTYLYGDGAFGKVTVNGAAENPVRIPSTNAQTIFQNRNTSAEFSYQFIGVNSFDFDKNLSTYITENDAVTGKDGNTAQTTVTEDFPVLRVSNGAAEIVTDYLNILTNGGYSKALSVNPGHVSAETSCYEWDGSDFVKSNEKASLQVYGKNTSAMRFYTTSDFDNQKDRFTLLTVTFTEEGESYNVHIPIVVRRMLEIDFTATLDYGTNFRGESFNELTNHILDSYQNPMTAYLSYTYNSAEGEKMTYGWKSYVDSGGNMTQVMEKTVIFKQDNPLPSETQLTLLDPITHKAYTYETKNEEKEIPFSEFVSLENPQEYYSSRNLGSIMGISVKPSDTGLFVQEADNDDHTEATVVYEGKYYHLAKDGEVGDRYEVNVDENNLSSEELTENYYLVVTVPDKTAAASNGFIDTKLSGTVPYHINYRLRKGGKDSHSGTASTYNLSTGYKQVLSETLSGEETSKAMTVETPVKISIKDTVSFPNGQLYDEKSDHLYQRFVVNLQSYIEDSVTGKTKTSSLQFPAGSQGEVKFFVKASGQYWNGESLVSKAVPLTSYTRKSTGGNLELPLSRDGTISTAIDLSGLRTILKNNNSGEAESSFEIEAVMDINIPASGLDIFPKSTLEAGIPKNFAQLTYSAQISNETSSLSYSSTKASLNSTQVKYYREGQTGSVLVYEADYIDQLGINLLDLQNDWLDSTKKYSRIVTTAQYDLSGIDKFESMLKSSDNVTFTLNLEQRGDDLEYTPVTDADKYLSVEVNNVTDCEITYDSEKRNWTFTIPKEVYLDTNGDFIISDFFDGTIFTIRPTIWVNIDNVESSKHKYSNYKLILQSKINHDEVALDATNSDYIVYTLCKMKPEFVERR